MARRSRARQRDRKNRGVSMVVVASSLVVLLAMAGLAIDLASLYVGRSEAQRAADAAALAGAQAIVQSQYPNVSQSVAESQGADQAATVADQNFVGGQNVKFSSTPAAACPPPANSVCFDFSNGDPRVTAAVQQTMPIYFMRIFGVQTANVAATATAEALGATVCVKPWLLPNCDPEHTVGAVASNTKPVSVNGILTCPIGQALDVNTSTCYAPAALSGNPECPILGSGSPAPIVAFSQYFISPPAPPGNCNPVPDPNACYSPASCDPTIDPNRCIVNPGLADPKAINNCGATSNKGGIIGECLNLKYGDPGTSTSTSGTPSQYNPVILNPNNPVPNPYICPGCAKNYGVGAPAVYENNIACCNTTAISCGSEQVQPLTGVKQGPTVQAVTCLVNPTGNGADVISFAGDPTGSCPAPSGGLLFDICAANSTTTQTGSSSVAGVPLYDGAPLCPGKSCPPVVTVDVQGFLQIFVQGADASGTVTGDVLGAPSCSAPALAPTTVRLIHN